MSRLLNNPNNSGDFKFYRPIISLHSINISTQKYNRLDYTSPNLIVIGLIINHYSKALDLRSIQVNIELSISVKIHKKGRRPKRTLKILKCL